MSAETLIDRLDKVKATGPDKWIARCPAHDDRGPSLSIRNVGDKLLLHCFAGCEPLNIVHAVGLEFTDLFADAKLTGEQGHRCKPTQSRIPARDLLMLVEREATVVALLAADFLKTKAIAESDWNRLAQSVERIGRARTHVR